MGITEVTYYSILQHHKCYTYVHTDDYYANICRPKLSQYCLKCQDFACLLIKQKLECLAKTDLTSSMSQYKGRKACWLKCGT